MVDKNKCLELFTSKEKLTKSIHLSQHRNLMLDPSTMIALKYLMHYEKDAFSEFSQYFKQTSKIEDVASLQEILNILKSQSFGNQENGESSIKKSYLVGIPVIVNPFMGDQSLSFNRLKTHFKIESAKRIKDVLLKHLPESAIDIDVECLNGITAIKDGRRVIAQETEFEEHLRNIPSMKLTAISGRFSSFFIPAKVTFHLKRKSDSIPDTGCLYNEAFDKFEIGDQIRTAISNDLNIYFSKKLFNVNVGTPQIFSDITEGFASYIHIEKIISALALQSIIAMPKEYFIEIRYDEKLNFIRVQCFKGNNVAYTYDYGSPVMYNHNNTPRDMDLINYSLSKLGFNCIINNKERKTSLLNAENEVRLSLVS